MENGKYEEKMQKCITSLKETFNMIRTGRASASIFDRVRVDYYGQKSPLNQVATIAIPEARSITIQSVFWRETEVFHIDITITETGSVQHSKCQTHIDRSLCYYRKLRCNTVII